MQKLTDYDFTFDIYLSKCLLYFMEIKFMYVLYHSLLIPLK